MDVVDAAIRSSGADAKGMAYTEAHGATMKALLSRYTQSGTLAEMDEEGEHPLFPTRSAERGGEARGPGLIDSLAGSSDAERRGGVGREVTFLDLLLRHLDNERLPQIKDQFLQRGNALSSSAFVSLLSSHLGNIEGVDERQVVAELTRLHLRLAAGEGRALESPTPISVSGGGGGGGGEGVSPFITQAADLGEGREASDSERTVSWGAFAHFLLDEGVVGDVVRNFNIVQVLSHIEFDKITPLHDEFVALGNALTLERFVVTMKSQFQNIFELTSLFDLYREERRLIAQLVSLYEMIDINGSNSLSWAEFTAFLVDQGMTDDAPREFNVIRFNISPVRDNDVLKSHCEKAVYFKHYDKIACIEQGSKSLKICTPDLALHDELTDFTQTPLCAEYIEKWAYVVVACSDLTLSFFDAGNKLKLVRRISTKTAQLVLCWSEAAQTLFSADHDGRIFAWDMAQVRAGGGRSYEPGQGDPSKEFLKPDMPMRHIESMESGDPTSAMRSPRSARGAASKQERLKASDPRHSNSGGTIVTMLLELPDLSRLASCGIDHNVMIWDVYTGKLMRTLKGHAMGVRCMAFAMSTKVLVTGGYDYNLFVWNPYVGKSIHTIMGHAAPIVGIEVLGASSSQLVSADADGFMKTWDLASSSYQCLQTISVDELLTLRAFISVPLHKRVYAVDRKFVAYDYQNTGVADQTDEEPIIKAIYHERLKVFITGCATHLRIWDAVTGAIKCVIPHKDSENTDFSLDDHGNDAEITDFCLDDRGRKVFIADHSGRIFVHSSTTGCLIKELTPHQKEKEVAGIIYCDGDRNVITVSWDRSIVVHDESDKKLPKVWRKATNIHNDDISCVAFSRHLGLIATGATDCVIAVREYERLRTLSHLLGHKTDINALAFVEPYALLVSSDVSGHVAIWSVPTPTGRDHKYVNEVLTRFINMQSLESSAAVNCLAPVCKANNQFILYTGDEDGDVRAWDLSHLLVAADIKPCEQKADWDPHKRAPPFDAAHMTGPIAKKAVAMETPELSIKIDEQVVKQLHSWRAHGDSIRSLGAYPRVPCIVTAGYDKMAKIWTPEGQLMSILRAYGVTPWHFPIKADEIAIDSETIDGLLSVLRKSDSTMAKPAKFRTTLTGFDLQNEVDVERQKDRLRGVDHKRQTLVSAGSGSHKGPQVHPHKPHHG